MSKRLRERLDSTGWSLNALGKNYNNNKISIPDDSLDQLLVILKQLPSDCYKLVQWVYQLGVWNNFQNDLTAIFLSSSPECNSFSPTPTSISISNKIIEYSSKPELPSTLSQLNVQNNNIPNTSYNYHNEENSMSFIPQLCKNNFNCQEYLIQPQLSLKKHNSNIVTSVIQVINFLEEFYVLLN